MKISFYTANIFTRVLVRLDDSQSNGWETIQLFPSSPLLHLIFAQVIYQDDQVS